MAAPRRNGDDEGDDYTKLRGGGLFNGHARWVIATVTTIGLVLFGWFAARSIGQIDKDQTRQDTQITELQKALIDVAKDQAKVMAELNTRQQVNEAATTVWREEIGRTLERILKEMGELREEKRGRSR